MADLKTGQSAPRITHSQFVVGESPRSLAIASETIIEPAKGWRPADWKELWERRDLLYFLVLRDIKVLYKQTILGFSWAIIRPVSSVLVFTLVFGNVARVASDGVPYAAFNYVAVVPWTYFASALTDSATSLVTYAHMLTKVYFPRLAFPLSPVAAKLVDFFVAFSLTAVMLPAFGIRPGFNVVFVPPLIMLMVLTTAGIGMWLCALAVQYRDVKHALPFVVQILMYAAPVVWPVSALTDRFGGTVRLIYGLYPMAAVIEGLRSALLNTRPMPWDLIAVGSLSALLITVSGAYYFKRMEVIFADVA